MRFKYIRLSAMMFLQFFVFGCTLPIFSLYMKDYLHFSGAQSGIILAMSAIPAFFAPLISSFIADRLISAERLLICCNIAGAAAMSALYFQSEFYSVLFFYLLYSLLTGPAIALTTAITFHHAPEAVKKFGGIRLWGTLGWFMAAWVFRYLWSAKETAEILRSALALSAFSSVILSIYASTLPLGLKRNKQVKVVLFPGDSLRVVLQPEILIFSLISILITFADRFYMFGGAPFLKHLGFTDRQILPVLSFGQIPEIIGLGVLGIMLKKFGLKKTLLLGAFFEISRFLIFLSGDRNLLYLGISLHGFTYSYFFIPLTMFLDTRCDKYSRAGVHQLFSMIAGIGAFAGNLFAGLVADLATTNALNQIDFSRFWLVALLFSVAAFSGILFFTSEQEISTVTATELKPQESAISRN
jgi:MFS family permease